MLGADVQRSTRCEEGAFGQNNLKSAPVQHDDGASLAQSSPAVGLRLAYRVKTQSMPGPRFELGTRRFSVACSTN